MTAVIQFSCKAPVWTVDVADPDPIRVHRFLVLFGVVGCSLVLFGPKKMSQNHIQSVRASSQRTRPLHLCSVPNLRGDQSASRSAFPLPPSTACYGLLRPKECENRIENVWTGPSALDLRSYWELPGPTGTKKMRKQHIAPRFGVGLALAPTCARLHQLASICGKKFSRTNRNQHTAAFWFLCLTLREV